MTSLPTTATLAFLGCCRTPRSCRPRSIAGYRQAIRDSENYRHLRTAASRLRCARIARPTDLVDWLKNDPGTCLPRQLGRIVGRVVIDHDDFGCKIGPVIYG